MAFKADNGGYEAGGALGKQLELVGDVSQRRRAISAGLLRNLDRFPMRRSWAT